MNTIEIQSEIAQFAKERDWDQFHSPKNLSMALAAECGELLEIFQWETEEATKGPNEKTLSKVEEEIADIQIYLLRLAGKLDINIEEAVVRKIEVNRSKYPVEKAKGNATKYNEL